MCAHRRWSKKSFACSFTFACSFYQARPFSGVTTAVSQVLCSIAANRQTIPYPSPDVRTQDFLFLRYLLQDCKVPRLIDSRMWKDRPLSTDLRQSSLASSRLCELPCADPDASTAPRAVGPTSCQ